MLYAWESAKCCYASCFRGQSKELNWDVKKQLTWNKWLHLTESLAKTLQLEPLSRRHKDKLAETEAEICIDRLLKETSVTLSCVSLLKQVRLLATSCLGCFDHFT